MNRERGFEWYSCFKNGRETIKHDSRSGRPSTSTCVDHADYARGGFDYKFLHNSKL